MVRAHTDAAPGRERSLRLMALALGVVAGFLLGEVALRVLAARTAASVDLRRSGTTFPPPYDGNCEGGLGANLGAIVRPSEHPELVYQLKPDLDTCLTGVRLQTSPDGLRAASNGTRLRSAPAPFRILLLGDSQAFGWGVPFEDTFGALLERDLTTPGRRVEVLNAGVPGYDTVQEAAFLRAYGAALRPDCVLVLFMGNDFDPPPFRLKGEIVLPPRSYVVEAVIRAWRRWHSPSADAQAELPAFGPVLRASQHEPVPPEYRDMVGPPAYRRALASMAETARRLRVPVVNFADYSYLMPEEQAEEFVRFQQSLGILHPEFHYPRAHKFWLSADDPHLNVEGHQALRRRIGAALRSLDVCRPP